MTRDMRLYIEDILDSIAKIEQYTKAINENVFLTNTQIQDSVLRRLEIIGEAVKIYPMISEINIPRFHGKTLLA
jgi:uncharacterized protein with HEPN domain